MIAIGKGILYVPGTVWRIGLVSGLLFCGACGESEWKAPEGNHSFAPIENDDRLAMVSGEISIFVGKEYDGLTYIVNGKSYNDATLREWSKALSGEMPNITVLIVPRSGVSSDDANLVAARIRADGLANTYVSE